MKTGIDTSHAESDTLFVSLEWQNLSDAERESFVTGALGQSGLSRQVRLLRASADGHVILELLSPMPAAGRGSLLLEVERMLKERVDSGVEVYLAPLQDRNVLRRLRGTRVKEER